MRERGQADHTAQFGFTVAALLLIGGGVVLPMIGETVAAVGLTTAEGAAGTFIGVSVLVVILLFSTGPLRGGR